MDAKSTVNGDVLESYTFVYDWLRGVGGFKPIPYHRPMNLSEMKATLLKRRRQRIRHSTYAYVAKVLLEDTAPGQPFRDRMVIDWWSRVIDPLEAESYDEERLAYFRKRLKEHAHSARHNAAVRRGILEGKEKRRLKPVPLAYMRHQVRRFSDRKLNYAAVDRVYRENDQAFEALTMGLLALTVLKSSTRIYSIAVAAKRDPRFEDVVTAALANPSVHLPNRTQAWIDKRMAELRNPFDLLPLEDPSRYQLRDEGLLRKLEEEYRKKI